jgi:outer membrane protein TolC
MKRLTTYTMLLISTNVFANDVQFEKLWSQVADNALGLKASREAVSAARINSERNAKHWYPTIYAQGQSYLTDDPGANLFGIMSQRQIVQADFTPSKLNEPGTNHFTKGAIGINLSLYEGGMKDSISKATKFQFESKKNEDKKNNLEFYSEISKNYFSLYALSNQKNELQKVSSAIESILSRYQIGNKSNPVGYSGLLGLKSLKNRLIAINDENTAKVKAYTNALKELSKNDQKLNFEPSSNLVSLLNDYLPTTQTEYKPTPKIKSFFANADAANEVVGAEKSRNLPRVGVFAESYAFNGDRDTATGFSTGIYLNWNLFSGNDIGASNEAVHNSHAAKYYAEAMSQKEKIEFDAQTTMEETLIKTLSTLDESQRLLDEQMNVANNLFKNGMISALQLVEVLSRRADLINSKTEVELNLVEAKSKKLLLTNNVPSILK